MERDCSGMSFKALLWSPSAEHDSKWFAYYVKETNLSMYIYAEDHQLYVMGSSYESVESSLKEKGEQALCRYRQKFLLANPDKIQTLIVNPRKIDTDNYHDALTTDEQDIMKTEQIIL